MTDTLAWTGKNRTINVLAVILMIGTVFLVFLGGLVTSNEVGMAVPDWPSTMGENMFTFNFLNWDVGVQLEHTHRLAGSAIGLMTIALGAAIFFWERRVWVRWLALAIFVGVCIQGALGGFRVVLNAILGQHLAAIHGCFAQAFFVLTVLMAVVTTRRWREAVPIAHDEAPSVQKAALLIAAAMYLQMVLGAIVRHYQGFLWIVHLAVGGILFFASLWLVMLVVLYPEIRSRLGSAVLVFGGGLVCQITLGVVSLFLTGILDADPHTVITRQEAVTVTTHLALGSILLGVSIYLAAASRRYLVAKRSAGEPIPSSNRSIVESVA